LFAGLALAAFGCSACSKSQSSTVGDVTATRSALTTSNGLLLNGLTTNGLWNNGLWNNGLWNNGLWNNGLWNNGLWNNGLWNNGLWNNGLWNNGLWNNGVWPNGLWNNGLWNNGLWNNGVGITGSPNDVILNNGYTRQLLQYIYSCAMPATTYDTILDPNQALPIYCSSTDGGVDGGTGNDGGTDGGSDGSAGCDLGYECIAGKCVIPLRGGGANGSGLAVNADGTTWWGQPAPGGATDLTTGNWSKCDETCQRWISACVLARTNAYGVHVSISLRAPDNAPQPIKAALAVSDVELHGAAPGTDAGGEAGMAPYSMREGAYYGNIFATTPVNPAPSSRYVGPAIGPIANTPAYYACAGPDSETPEITNRFCSSQGDESVISVPGVCWPAATDPSSPEPPVCDGIDASGNIYGCYTSSNAATPRTHYDQVLTVYLQQSLSVCDNGVCEAGEDSPSDPHYCPSDCHPAGWAKTFPYVTSGVVNLVEFEYSGSSAVSPDGQSVVLVGNAATIASHNISFGGSTSPLGPGTVVVAKYSIDGTYLWDTRFAMPNNSSYGVSIAGDGSIVVAGFGSAPVNLAKLTPDGQVIAGWPISLGGPSATVPAGGRLGTDSNGDIFVSNLYAGTVTFATTPSVTTYTTPSPVLADGADLLIVKILPDGTPSWAKTLGGTDVVRERSVEVTPSGDLLVTVDLGATSPASNAILRISSSGIVSWLKSAPPGSFYLGHPGPVEFITAVADTSGDIYTTGYFSGTYDFGPGCGPATATVANAEYFLAKYSANGSTCRWLSRAAVRCPPQATYCADSLFEGGALTFDPEGNIIVGGMLDGLLAAQIGNPQGDRSAWPPGTGAVADFGAGPFETYRYPHIFAASYTSSGSFRWAKQIPIVLRGTLRGLNVDSRGHLLLSGNYTGSMQVDDRLLIGAAPEFILQSYQNTYLASFAQPSTADKTTPVIGVASDQAGSVLNTVPSNIRTEATGPSGAKVFFMPPSAFDSGYSGANVTCSPAPNTMFALGTTPVVCTATDPMGNTCTASDPQCTAQATFTVTVVDTIPPMFQPVNQIQVQAQNARSVSITTSTVRPDSASQATCMATMIDEFQTGTTFNANITDERSAYCVDGPLGVAVVDYPLGSVLLPVADINVQAFDETGSAVTYPTPIATDQVDGNVTVTCLPASGSMFPVGTTIVTCSASDHSKNQAQTTFKVTVSRPFGGACTSTADCASGTCVDGVCCNTQATSCGQCQACNVPGFVGTCALTSGAGCNAPEFLGADEVTVTSSGASLSVTSTDALSNVTTAITCPDPAVSLYQYRLDVSLTDSREISCGNGEGLYFDELELGSDPLPAPDITVQAWNPTGAYVSYREPVAYDQVDGAIPATCVPGPGAFAIGTTAVVCTATNSRSISAHTTFNVSVKPPFGGSCTSTADCAFGSCVDGVCCNTSATSCGQCQACNLPGSPGTCTPTSGGSCSDDNACTQGDTCQTGACVGTPVTCSSSDQCHVAGTCDPSSGLCSTPTAPDGTVCNDGSACTRTDTCQAGVCVGSNPVTCSASDQCHAAGTCDPSTGVCSNPIAPNGTACSDGNACTAGDACQSGSCASGTPVTCTASDQCHIAGTCDPGTGTCSNPAAPNGATCNDGNACTQTDTCQAGVCTGTNPVVCNASDQCHVAGTCDPSSGICSNPAAANGATCNDGNACTQTDTCQTGVCVGANPVVCAAEDACHVAGTCNTSTGACSNPIAPPTLNPGTNQTVVGSCSSAAVTYTYPTVANGCSATVTCTPVPGNSYGAHSVSCTATDSAGTSSPVPFTVTVLQPLTIKIQPPLSGDNDTVDNVVKDGSTVPNKILLYACGTNVTSSASVVAKLGVTYQQTGGSNNATTVTTTFNGAGDTNGVMVFDGTYYHYNLATTGFATTSGIPAFYQETITVAYQSAPSIIVGTDSIQIDTK
jgi:hypothetical protein